MQNIIDINFDSPKQQIRLNGDDTKIIELNLTDSGIIVRFNDAISEITALMNKRNGLRSEITEVDTNTEENLEKFSKVVAEFAETETEMRGIINKLFDYDVCTPMVGKASVFSVKNGEFLYETIIEKLVGLYESTITAETEKIKARMKKHTQKYLK